jgi:murein DD-endopeptidase MepM/ murein hydrolase activator NlpD
MKKIMMFFAALLMLVSCGCSSESEVPVPDSSAEQDENASGICLDSLRCVEGKVKNGQFFSNLMASLGLDSRQSYDLTQACGEVFDVRSLRVGNKYKAYYEGDVLQYVVYTKDKVNEVVFKCTEPYEVTVSSKPVTVEKKYADVTISSSLWVDMRTAGVSPLLILDLSDIYAWTVDFFGLQKGDRFRVLYDEKVCDGETIGIDTVRYAVFSHNGRNLPMVMFNQGDGGNIWWDENGASMRKAFLKAPLKFSRISSGFSYARKHPVTKKVRPHTGVDYAAPTGTPVMTIGDGVVTSVKYEGAGGKTIRIKHNSVYSTAYLHLSKYAKGIKAGTRVRQGEVIGYVGSTGRSTGPHLDFRVWKNGTPINPLKMESPPAEPIRQSNKKAFDETHAKYKAQIDEIQAREISSELFKFL